MSDICVKPHDPLMEKVACLLHGIEIVPAKEQRKMVGRACTAVSMGVVEIRNQLAAMTAERDKLKAEIERLEAIIEIARNLDPPLIEGVMAAAK